MSRDTSDLDVRIRRLTEAVGARVTELQREVAEVSSPEAVEVALWRLQHSATQLHEMVTSLITLEGLRADYTAPAEDSVPESWAHDLFGQGLGDVAGFAGSDEDPFGGTNT